MSYLRDYRPDFVDFVEVKIIDVIHRISWRVQLLSSEMIIKWMKKVFTMPQKMNFVLYFFRYVTYVYLLCISMHYSPKLDERNLH